MYKVKNFKVRIKNAQTFDRFLGSLLTDIKCFDAHKRKMPKEFYLLHGTMQNFDFLYIHFMVFCGDFEYIQEKSINRLINVYKNQRHNYFLMVYWTRDSTKIWSKARTTRIYLDGRVLRPIIKHKASFRPFLCMVILIDLLTNPY